MKQVLTWTIIILGILALFDLVGRKFPDQQQEEERIPVDVDKALTYCLMPKAQYGQYSSYDGGKSAVSLLTEGCPAEMAAWIEQCEKDSGEDEKTCGVKALVISQAAIKKFNK